MMSGRAALIWSLLPKSAAAHGIGFTELCLKIAELSLALRS